MAKAQDYEFAPLDGPATQAAEPSGYEFAPLDTHAASEGGYGFAPLDHTAPSAVAAPERAATGIVNPGKPISAPGRFATGLQPYLHPVEALAAAPGNFAEQVGASARALGRSIANAGAGGISYQLAANKLAGIPEDASPGLLAARDALESLAANRLAERRTDEPIVTYGSPTVATLGGMLVAPQSAAVPLMAALGGAEATEHARQSGASENQQLVSGTVGAGVGAGVGALGGIGPAETLTQRAITGAVRGPVMGGGQQLAGNLEAKYLSGYDPDRPVFQGVPESAVAGLASEAIPLVVPHRMGEARSAEPAPAEQSPAHAPEAKPERVVDTVKDATGKTAEQLLQNQGDDQRRRASAPQVTPGSTQTTAATPRVPGPKQPWQQTREEYTAEHMPANAMGGGVNERILASHHAIEVHQALARGERPPAPIVAEAHEIIGPDSDYPAEITKDYPFLAPAKENANAGTVSEDARQVRSAGAEPQSREDQGRENLPGHAPQEAQPAAAEQPAPRADADEVAAALRRVDAAEEALAQAKAGNRKDAIKAAMRELSDARKAEAEAIANPSENVQSPTVNAQEGAGRTTPQGGTPEATGGNVPDIASLATQVETGHVPRGAIQRDYGKEVAAQVRQEIARRREGFVPDPKDVAESERLAREADAQRDAQRQADQEYDLATTEQRIERGIALPDDRREVVRLAFARLGIKPESSSHGSDYYEIGGRKIRVSDHDPRPTYEEAFGEASVDINTAEQKRPGASRQTGNLTPQQIDDLVREVAERQSFDQPAPAESGGAAPAQPEQPAQPPRPPQRTEKPPQQPQTASGRGEGAGEATAPTSLGDARGNAIERFSKDKLREIVAREFPEVALGARKMTDTLGISEHSRLEDRLNYIEEGRDYAKLIARVFQMDKAGDLHRVDIGKLEGIPSHTLKAGDTFDIDGRTATVKGVDDNSVTFTLGEQRGVVGGSSKRVETFTVPKGKLVPANEGSLRRGSAIKAQATKRAKADFERARKMTPEEWGELSGADPDEAERLAMMVQDEPSAPINWTEPGIERQADHVRTTHTDDGEPIHGAQTGGEAAAQAGRGAGKAGDVAQGRVEGGGAEVQAVPGEPAKTTGQQLGLLGGRYAGGVTGSKTGGLFGEEAKPAKPSGPLTTDEKIAKQYDPTATPEVFGGREPARAKFKLTDATGKTLSEHPTRTAAEHARDRLGDPRAKVEEAGSGPAMKLHSGIPLEVQEADLAHAPALISGDTARAIGNKVSDILSGRTLPKLTRASAQASDAAHEFAASDAAHPLIAADRAQKVLGDKLGDPEFRNKLGAALVEDRLRAKRGAFQKAGETDKAAAVKSIIGTDRSPFQTEKQYQDFLNSDDTKAMIERHKSIVEPEQEALFQQASPGSALDTPGLQTGAFLKLNPLQEEGPPRVPRTTIGRLTNTFRRKPGSAQRATGAGEYNYDYAENVAHAYADKYAIAKQNAFVDALAASGNAKLVRGAARELPTIKGEPTDGIPIQRRTLVVSDDGQTHAVVQNETLYVRKSLGDEVRRVFNTDRRVEQNGLSWFINKAQMAGLGDATFHTANIVSGLVQAEGGGVVLARLRKLPGVNVVDALARIGVEMQRVVRETPEIKTRLADLAVSGVDIRKGHGGIMGRWLELVDKSGRIASDKLFDTLVDRNIARDTVANRRNFNNQFGVYNRRLTGRLTQWLKDWGVSPFVTAGKTFNRMSVKAITGDPGFQATSLAKAAQVRAERLFFTFVATSAAAAALNYALTGKVSGRDGVPWGAVDTGKTNKDGKAVYIDLLKYNLARRGLRITGINALIEGRRQGQTTGNVIDKMADDIVSGQAHPYLGPTPNLAFTSLTGRRLATYLPQVAEAPAPGQSRFPNQLEAAGKDLNPTIKGMIEGYKESSDEGGNLNQRGNAAVVGAVKGLASAAGVGSANPPKPEAIHGAQLSAFYDDVARQARKLPAERRVAFIKQKAGELEGQDRARFLMHFFGNPGNPKDRQRVMRH